MLRLLPVFAIALAWAPVAQAEECGCSGLDATSTRCDDAMGFDEADAVTLPPGEFGTLEPESEATPAELPGDACTQAGDPRCNLDPARGPVDGGPQHFAAAVPSEVRPLVDLPRKRVESTPARHFTSPGRDIANALERPPRG